MLEAKGITFQYKNGKPLMKNLHLHIEQGEIVGLFGYSGTGKTTLAQIISGSLQPMEGKVLVDGTPLTNFKRKPVQLVWQHPETAINPTWKLEKILLEDHSIDEEILDSFGIHKSWLKRRSRELSSGELQRFCLARALGKNTRYLIADEISTMLDSLTQAQIWHTLQRYSKERKLGILAISHDKNLLHRISSRIISFQDICRGIEEFL